MELKNHYVNYHGLAHDNYNLCKLFEKEERGGTTCWHCRRLFKDNRRKRIHMFFNHHTYRPPIQMGGSRNLNILHMGSSITRFSIGYEQYRDTYNFFDSAMVGEFLDNVYGAFRPEPNTPYLFQVNFEILNQRLPGQGPDRRTESLRGWNTNAYRSNSFDPFTRESLEWEILNRVIINGETESSCFFSRYGTVTVVVTTVKNATNLFRS